MATKRRFIKNAITLVKGLTSHLPTLSFVAYAHNATPAGEATLFVFAFDVMGAIVGGYDVEVDATYTFITPLPTIAYFFECSLEELGDCFNSTAVQAMWHAQGHVDTSLRKIYAIDKRPFLVTSL